jgi:hypothetical protein
VLQVQNVKVRSFDLDYLDVFWSVDDTYEDVRDYEFYVERAEAEYGPFHSLAGPIVDKYSVRDATVRGQHGFYRNYYYRIRVRHAATADEQVFPKDGSGINLAAEPDLIALEMARQRRIKLEELAGRRVWVFPRKTSGQRCSCVDRVTQRQTRANHAPCYDTGWVGGFNTPIQTSALIASPDETNIHYSQIDANLENTVGSFPNFPELFEGDIIVEFENVRWRVGSRLTKYKKGRSVIHQQVPLHRIPEGDIEYSLPIGLTRDETRDFLATPPRNYTNPHSLQAAKDADAALAIFGKML